METLPVELLHHIALFVQSHSRRDLCSLSLTSRTWYDATLPCLYNTLTIKFRDERSLEKAIEKLDNDGLGRYFFKYARKLDLVCLATPLIETQRGQQLWDIKDWGMEFLDLKPPAASSAFLEDRLIKCCDPELWFLNRGVDYYRRKDWQPLVSLIAAIEHLEEVNYMMRNMFPSQLHDALCQHHPMCRLNIWTSQSLSLDRPGLGRTQLSHDHPYADPFAMDVLQFPGLRTLAINYSTERNSRHRGWVHQDEILPFVCRAPNLRHLSICAAGSSDSNPITKVKQEWEDYLTAIRPTPVASLESVSFGSPRGFGPWEEILLKVANVVNLSQLRSLDMCVHTDPTMLSRAAGLLKNLNRLYIHIQPWGRDQPDLAADDAEMIDAVCAFNPLQFLCLRGLRSVISLRQIFSQHGQSLKGLSLEVSERGHSIPGVYDNGYKYPIFLDGAHLTRELAGSCPNLQELRVPIQRHAGNSQECSLYQALGKSFPHLHTLMLDLKYDPRQWPIGPEPELHDVASCFRESVINAATDDKLAMGIWNIIVSSQPTRRLRKLRITPFGSAFFSREEKHVLHHVGSSYLITRSDLDYDAVEVAEIGRMAWEVWREADISEEGSLRLPKEVKKILNELWPLGPGQKKWREMNWKSFPLQIDGDGLVS